MARKPSPLSGAFKQQQERMATGLVETPPPEPERFAYQPVQAKPKARGIFLGGYVDETTKRQFKVLLAERGLTEQAALAEMLDDFFSKYGKHRIASRLSEGEP